MSYAIPLIDYRKIAAAQEYYASRGYTELAVPWIVTHAAYRATRPTHVREFLTLDGYLNASGEQSFIELLQEGASVGKQFCITPCFRDESAFTDLHHKYFFKVELIDTDVTAVTLARMIADAKTFLDQYFPADAPTKVVRTDDGEETFDIVDSVHGIELGSYGIRTHVGFRWVYGTGIALPRLDTVRAMSAP
jgi:aspartyl/asparaginyl-tRNA synthetase